MRLAPRDRSEPREALALSGLLAQPAPKVSQAPRVPLASVLLERLGQQELKVLREQQARKEQWELPGQPDLKGPLGPLARSVRQVRREQLDQADPKGQLEPLAPLE